MAVPTAITDLSTTAASNSPQGSESIGSPGKIDDYFRGYGAIQRAESLNKSWERWNDTPTFISATQFSVAGDLTARYLVNRRIKCTVTAGTVYGRITASAFTTLTTVTVSLDSGNLDSGLSEVQLGPEGKAFWTTSAGLAAQLSDETGSGSLVFATAPTFSGGRVTVQANSEMYSIGMKYGAGLGTIFLGASNSATPDFVVSNTAGTGRLTVTDDGRVYGSALHNNAGSLTGTANHYIASGTYTPTFTSASNLDSTPTNNAAKWIRVGNVVTVSGSVSIDPTAAGLVTFTGTLPIASNLIANADLNGFCGDALGAGGISGNAVSDVANFNYTAPSGSVTSISYLYQYEVK